MNDRLVNLDGLRALACLLVVLSHMPFPLRHEIEGHLGVGVFFTLSGFLMAHLYCPRNWDRPSMVSYGIARFSRIAPIYWCVIIFCVLISFVNADPDFPMRIMGYKQIARHVFFGGSISVFWSISPEIQYYIFFVFIWWAISARNSISIAIPAAFGICILLLLSHRYWPGLAMPSKIQFFLSGTLAGIAPRIEWKTPAQSLSLGLLQIASVGILITPFVLYQSKEQFYDSIEIGFAIGFSVYCLSYTSRWSTAVLGSPLLRTIGQASFSIYLMHVLVFYFGAKLFGLTFEKYEASWLIVGFCAIVIPVFISKYAEIPLQRFTRSFLEKVLGRVLVTRRSAAPVDVA